MAASPALSHLSALSANSSSSHLPEFADKSNARHSSNREADVFRWTRLKQIEDIVFGAAASGKAAAVLGPVDAVTPTVLAADGTVCLGTATGKVLVFGFKQTLQGICGSDTSGRWRTRHLLAECH
jgi:hypothetical protein